MHAIVSQSSNFVWNMQYATWLSASRVEAAPQFLSG